jgi:NADH:ubiquinone oxidoreductase subunit H
MLFIIKATNFCTLNMDLENTSALFIGRTFVFIFLKIILLLVSIAYFTLAERKIMGSIQRRRGPNVVGFWGLLQPLADGLKLFSKQMLIPSKANSNMFVLSPLLILTFSLLT